MIEQRGKRGQGGKRINKEGRRAANIRGLSISARAQEILRLSFVSRCVQCAKKFCARSNLTMLRILIASLVSIVFLSNAASNNTGKVLNAAALGHEPQTETRIAAGSIASFRGSALGATVTVNGQAATVLHVSSAEVIFVVPENVIIGPAEIVVTSTDGTASKAAAVITSAAPGVFTISGDGKGEGIILDADTLLRGPFDPTNGQRRLSIFATGVRHASSLSVSIGGQPIVVETVAPGNLSGLDEIHVLLPSKLSGAGSSTLIVEADNIRSNPVTVLIGGSSAPGKVVISQVFGGGGNSGAPFRNDYIEIFNAGSTPVNLAGWSVQYASATASTWSNTPLGALVLAPGQHYLVQQAGGNNGGALPTPDATGTIAMAAGAGKVALVKSTTALTGACPKDDPNIVDFVGYGNAANCFRGSGAAPAASNTNAVTRTTNGCADTRNNASDFTLATPNPRNTIAPFNRCAITESMLTCFPDALGHRRNHNFAPALRLRRFP
jgi:uncharacterized protein (TIGR03437 family)